MTRPPDAVQHLKQRVGREIAESVVQPHGLRLTQQVGDDGIKVAVAVQVAQRYVTALLRTEGLTG